MNRKINYLMKKNLYTIILLFLITLFASCSFVTVTICYDTSYSVRKSVNYKNMIPLKVTDLKKMLTSDTSHYKIVVIYDVCCGGCKERFETIYPDFLAKTDTNEVRWIFIHSSTGGLGNNEWFLRNNGINSTMYYFKDDTPAFASKIKNAERYVNISRYLADCDSINYPYGIPLNYLVNKNGKIKLLYKRNNKGGGVLAPMQLHEIQDSIHLLDFYKIDSLLINNDIECQSSNCGQPKHK